MQTLIAANLKHHMQLQQLGAKELARRAQLKPSFIYDVLKGRSINPSTVKLAGLARCLGIPLSALVEEHPAQIHSPALKVSHTTAFDGRLTPPPLLPPAGLLKQCPFSFSQRWLAQQLGCTPDAIRWYHMPDDTMSPTLLPGDTLLVDTAHTQPSPSGIYLVREHTEARIRRVESFYTTHQHYLRLMADNPCYSSYEKQADTIEVLGRIVWSARQQAPACWQPSHAAC